MNLYREALESAERHQARTLAGRQLEHWLSVTPLERQVCEGCGCTTLRACAGGCYWIAPRRCSRCGDKR